MRILCAGFLLAAQCVLAQMDFDLLTTAGMRVGVAAGNGLTNMLAAYWRMDATNAAGSDAWGTNVLTPCGGIVCGAGLLTNCVNPGFLQARYLTAVHGPDISTAEKSWAFAGWFKLHSNAIHYLVEKREGTSGTWQWDLERTNVTGLLYFHYVTNGTGAFGRAVVISSNAPALDVWHLFTCMVNTTNKEMILAVDLAEWVTNGFTAVRTSNLGTAPLWFGDDYWSWHAMDDCMFWTNRVLSMSEVTNLYNGGNGTNFVQRYERADPNGPLWAGGGGRRGSVRPLGRFVLWP